MDKAQQAINWWQILVPVILSIGGGTILGNIIVAKFKEGIDKRQAIACRVRDHHLERVEILKRLIAAIVGACSSACDARQTDLNKNSNIQEVAARSRNNRERHIDNFERMSDEARLEAERYGLIPDWCNLPERHLVSYVDFVLSGRLGFALDADSYQYGEASDAHRHAKALLRDLRLLIGTEEALARDVFITKRKHKTFCAPQLQYFDALKFYFKGKDIDIKKLDMSVLENRLLEEEWKNEERKRRVVNAPIK